MTIYAIDFDGTFVENRFSDIGPAIKELLRNTRGFNCTPDYQWKDRVAIMNFKDYIKDEEIQSV